jgi:hypothetical protein
MRCMKRSFPPRRHLRAELGAHGGAHLLELDGHRGSETFQRWLEQRQLEGCRASTANQFIAAQAIAARIIRVRPLPCRRQCDDHTPIMRPDRCRAFREQRTLERITRTVAEL